MPKSLESLQRRRDQFKKYKKPVVYEYRNCLTCGGRFYSEGTGNRVCSPCKETDAWKAGGAEHSNLPCNHMLRQWGHSKS